jgi:hypothetical protein
MMPLMIKPGVNVEHTLSQNETTISKCSFIRWRAGMPEKRGGWAKFTNTQYNGIIKQLHPWKDLDGEDWLAAASTVEVRAHSNKSPRTSVDITPQYIQTSASLTLATQNAPNANSVIVTWTGIGITPYDNVVWSTPVAIGGTIVFGAYPVTTYISQDQFTITVAKAATSATSVAATPSYATTAGSAMVTATLAAHGYVVGQDYPAQVSTVVGGLTVFGVYPITSVTTNTFTFTVDKTATTSDTASAGQSITAYTTWAPPLTGVGYGVGPYGAGPYSIGVIPPGANGTPLPATDWWLDNWGEILVGCPAKGPLFKWQDNSGLKNMTVIANSPTANAGCVVLMPQQQLLAWGTTYNGIQDPLQIRWSDVGNMTTWTPTYTNQAGGFRISTGNVIQRVLPVSQQLFIFTDVDVWSATYVGLPTVWGFSRLGAGCGLIAPHAAVVQQTEVHWMSQKAFYKNAGAGVQAVQCPVWDAVFQNLNPLYIDKIVAASNGQFNEIMWFYPSMQSTGENDSYVCHNILEDEWDLGELNRTAWTDQSILGSALGASSDGYVMQHEVSPDADGTAINASFETGLISLSEAQDFVFVDLCFPDMKWLTYSQDILNQGVTGEYVPNLGGNIEFTFSVYEYLGSIPKIYGPYTVNYAAPFIALRMRGRYMSIKVSSSDLGSFWRLGKIRFRIAQDGRR